MTAKKSLKSSIKHGIKSVNGTAGEAFENLTFENMVKKYGEEAAYKFLEPVLKEAGETVESFTTYRRVKRKVQNDEISIYRAEQNLEEEAKKAVEEEFGGAPSY
ncbi:hypothetical protein L4D77_28450 [Photobacterium frigidiphilum]|uniref:hypothetical protein n=1 Tax=Photobacterium frigidiphilum TaxID=264736 RepID=UPI003D10B275